MDETEHVWRYGDAVVSLKAGVWRLRVLTEERAPGHPITETHALEWLEAHGYGPSTVEVARSLALGAALQHLATGDGAHRKLAAQYAYARAAGLPLPVAQNQIDRDLHEAVTAVLAELDRRSNPPG